MQITRTNLSDTQISLEIVTDEEQLKHAKEHAVAKLSRDVKVPGFRSGKAPAAMVEKAINPAVLQEEFLNDALNHAYSDALVKEKINPVSQPTVEVTKFVPYSVVEFKATFDVIGEVKLADYKKLNSKKEVETVGEERIDEVIENMRTQMATKKDVERAAEVGDQAWIDFEGKDEKGVEVKGAKGTNYPLLLGSNTFIPGFEDHIVGLSAGDEKTFTLTFPKDYGVKALQSKKVTFSVTIVKVQSVEKPEVDEAFVKKVSPELKDIESLRKDIKKQLEVEAENIAQRNYENAIVAELVEKSSVAVPQALLDEQAENVMRDLMQNIVYRGQTFEEYLDAIGMTKEEQREKEILPEANRRLKAGILLSEVAEKENLSVTPEELEIRVSVLKQRYASDPEMQKQIDDQANRREIGAQILTEKTIAKIISLQK